jgi:FlaA1/EpsC-like NDP-sugar epimerase
VIPQDSKKKIEQKASTAMFDSKLSMFTNWLKLRSRGFKLGLIIFFDAALLLVAVFGAYMLRISALAFPSESAWHLYLIGPMLSIALAALFGVYGSVMRTYTTHLETRILHSQLAVPPLWGLAVLELGSFGFARSVFIIYFALALIGMVMLRRLIAFAMRDRERSGARMERVPVLVYGAGHEGVQLVEALRRQSRYIPVAFMDTDYTVVGRKVAGLNVLSTDNLLAVVSAYRPREVMIAKPAQTRASRKALVEMFIGHGLQVKLIPNMNELADGQMDLQALRPLRLEDLLGRDPVPPDKELMTRAITEQVVMVTGAGGSIGSELVRQVARFSPRTIILVESSEFALFEIHREIEQSLVGQSQPFNIVPVLANIMDDTAMNDIMAQHQVQVVLHAAAYKHVRMVQENATVGIRNNVFGTKILAEAALKNGVQLFILVSTDKAVRPTSVMGASKRLAEMVTQSLAAEPNHRTVFAMVRFGNVLGSTGSVVPLFKDQIARGGPILVTHPDVTRFFMLIPEAAQLVIQAGAMAKGGEVFVLDMGEPVKILDLAQTMVELAGLTCKSDENPEGDVAIKFTGLREGEKLFEELQIGTDVSNTTHQRIMRSKEAYLNNAALETQLDKLYKIIDSNDSKRAVDHVFRVIMMHN